MDDRIPRIDEQRSFHGRLTTIVVFAVLISLAVAAWMFEPDYMAHVPVSVGVCALDPARSGPALDAFADHIREKGGGNVTWRYLPADEAPSGCDFYILTPLQMASDPDSGLQLALLASSGGGAGRSRGVVIRSSEDENGRWVDGPYIFPHRWSMAGYLSARQAMVEAGAPPGELEARTRFTDCLQCDEEVLFGVVFGRYGAGGISAGRLDALLEIYPGLAGRIRIVKTGPPVTELLVAADPAVEPWKRRGFLSRLPFITSEAGGLLRDSLIENGIWGFVEPGRQMPDLFEAFPDSVMTDIPGHRT